jgi:hypothetical protein
MALGVVIMDTSSKLSSVITAWGAITGIVLNILDNSGDLLVEEEQFFLGDFSASLLELFFFFMDEDLDAEASPSVFFFFFLGDFSDVSASMLELFSFFLGEDLDAEASPSVFFFFFLGDFSDVSASMLELFSFFLDEDLDAEESPSVFFFFFSFFLSDTLAEGFLLEVSEDFDESLRLDFLLLLVASVVERQVDTRSRISASKFILEY